MFYFGKENHGIAHQQRYTKFDNCLAAFEKIANIETKNLNPIKIRLVKMLLHYSES